MSLERLGFLPIGRELLRDMVALVGEERAIDSAQAWLGGLTWDGVPRLDIFCVDVLGAEDTPYSAALGRYIWTALAGRILEPGIKADMAPILVGPQGCGKSTAIAALVPPALPDAFAEVDLDLDDDDLSRLLRGKLVGEIAELRGLATRAGEHIKAFITRRRDEWIPKYKEHRAWYDRRIIFVGSTNEDAFLSDRTGNRRWLPLRVAVAQPIDLERLVRDRDQLWAEAAALVLADGIAYEEMERQAREADAQDAYMLHDSWEQVVGAWLTAAPDAMTPPPGRADYLYPADVLLGALGIEAKRATRADETRLGAAMRANGWTRSRRRDERGARAYVYVPG